MPSPFQTTPPKEETLADYKSEKSLCLSVYHHKENPISLPSSSLLWIPTDLRGIPIGHLTDRQAHRTNLCLSSCIIATALKVSEDKIERMVRKDSREPAEKFGSLQRRRDPMNTRILSNKKWI
ncbi:unnamed protein product [Linum trigynum]|uniref:Uncharacterized protein n=1 Tax=Linum trigynum TaxID=586398 RepID=A0AAV2EVU9_9ROSI